MHQWHSYSSFEQTSEAAANYLEQLINQSLQARGVCHVILPGGNTPILTFQYLAKKPLRWANIHWYPGDERCCPVGDPARNDVMLEKNLWSLLPAESVSETNIHTIPAELGAEEAAEVYTKLVYGISCFDIAVLGMGEDGHTASLFPGNSALADKRKIVPVFNSPKAPPERVTFGLETLQATRHKVVLASGKSKSVIIARIKKGDPLPVNCLGAIEWYVDQDAMSV